ncbi:MAG: hypothetical protein RBG13Loki_2595 [Promethearchaeota archaeon CR_4]|nr:MAG: hypothetical protein RBG13Loki_2595 [Candidatus Lokiarchaeota archaeon CR_4]
MPTFGHVFYGFCLLLPIIYFARERFNYKVAFIFLFNQIFGPDIVFLYFNQTPFHSIVGFVILTIPLSLVFSYASRFSMQKSEAGFPLKIEDGGIREIKWGNAYLVTVAGGISHFFIDQFFHFEQEMLIWPGVTITYDEILAWGGPVYHIFDPLMVIGEVIVVITLLLSLWYLRKGYKDTAKVFAIITAISFIIMVLGAFDIGRLTAIFGGERELAVICFGVVYIFMPLMLVMLVARNVQDHPVQAPDQPRIPRERHLKIVATISVILGAFFVLYGTIAILFSDILTDLIIAEGGEVTSGAVVFLGFYYASIAALLLVGAIGLFFRNRICRYLAIVASLYLSILGFPLAIALFLCEKDVKALFAPKPRD